MTSLSFLRQILHDVKHQKLRTLLTLLGITWGTVSVSLLVAFGPSDSMCMLEVFDADKVESWQDVGVEPTAALSIDGHRTERFDDIRGLGATISSAYSVYASGHVYGFFCSADRAPSDRWFSIAETLRLQPIETTEAARQGALGERLRAVRNEQLRVDLDRDLVVLLEECREFIQGFHRRWTQNHWSM